MESRSLAYICSACNGELRAGNAQAEVQQVCTDSRRVRKGDLFFALKGDRFDGHAFVEAVAQAGASALVLERDKLPAREVGCAVIAVQNTRQALGQLAARYRADFTLPVVVVGGSNGKTTSKELLASVLRQKFNTLWSEASFNNDIGVPMTLLNLARTHGAAVLEAGTNHPGELAPLVRMIQPRFGVLTTIGREHLEFFGDVAGVAREEGAIAELLPDSGKLFLNGDNEWTPGIEKRSAASVVRVGLGEKNDWQASDLRMGATGLSFQVKAPASRFNGEYRIQLVGQHQAVNALFAIAVAAELGLGSEEIRRGLAACKPAKMRLEVFEVNGVTILNDAYNANADSMKAAIQTLQEYPAKGRRVAVLGTMAELGSHSGEAHEEAGRCAARAGIAHLLALGPWAETMTSSARRAGLENVTAAPDVPAAVTVLKNLLRTGDVVLLKASRSAGFERIHEALIQAG